MTNRRQYPIFKVKIANEKEPHLTNPYSLLHYRA